MHCIGLQWSVGCLHQRALILAVDIAEYINVNKILEFTVLSTMYVSSIPRVDITPIAEILFP